MCVCVCVVCVCVKKLYIYYLSFTNFCYDFFISLLSLRRT